MFTHSTAEYKVAMLKSLASLIKMKCGMDVTWRLEESGMSIVLEDNAFVDSERQNARPIRFLKAAGATQSTESTKGLEHVPYCTNSVLTFANISQCTAAIAAFNALPSLEAKPLISKAC